MQVHLVSFVASRGKPHTHEGMQILSLISSIVLYHALLVLQVSTGCMTNVL